MTKLASCGARSFENYDVSRSEQQANEREDSEYGSRLQLAKGEAGTLAHPANSLPKPQATRPVTKSAMGQ